MEDLDDLGSCSSFSLDDLNGLDDDELWLFGYGSILWKTGFAYKSKHIGYVEGHVRRFWQGSIKHRGTPESPGRVATLVPCKQGRVWGVAYCLKGAEMISMALEHLAMRECRNGGYVVKMLTFTAASTSPPSSMSLSSHFEISDKTEAETYSKRFTLRVLAFTALANNALYLGPENIDRLADDVISRSGSCGHNVEYVIRLAEFVRDNFPEEQDDHLFDLEEKIKQKLTHQGLTIEQIIASHAPKISNLIRRDSAQG